MKIAVAEFRARNIKENYMATIYIEHKDGYYYYIAFNGRLGQRYDTLEIAKRDIEKYWGSWHDFKLLV